MYGMPGTRSAPWPDRIRPTSMSTPPSTVRLLSTNGGSIGSPSTLLAKTIDLDRHLAGCHKWSAAPRRGKQPHDAHFPIRLLVAMSRYVTKKVLANALYGQVLLCQDSHTGDMVAIKRIHVAASAARQGLHTLCTVSDDIGMEKAVHECLSSHGGHSHVLRLRHSFVQQGYDHLVMDYCPNGDLFDLVNKVTLDPAVVQRYFRQIVHGVAFMHSRGFAHRDLSLENVLLDDRHNCHVCDFGLVAPTTELRKDMVGKPFYMAPEIVAKQVYSPVKADVWSLGVMLFMMLTGAPLCETASPEDSRFHYFLKNGLRSLLHSWKLSHRFDCETLDLVEKMLHPNPKERVSMVQVLQHPYVGGRQPVPAQKHSNKSTNTARPSFVQRWISRAQKAVKAY
ncbi:CAMK protein kinase [Aphanomyces invadans]|uniref:CAMK protein kinase n=1 Tax=Aphanomyces invadans TaxID=157072 RepID=A0A024TWJ6_9STRA|nr:CAMK protein kinase [Aphanomyces invadans]ETV98383.1 CAMK protein kinase [Aphanomyces invadans]|eukprot:XP_008873258.1 CAMK protein kinase [Aphanomyces invadans]